MGEITRGVRVAKGGVVSLRLSRPSHGPGRPPSDGPSVFGGVPGVFVALHTQLGFSEDETFRKHHRDSWQPSVHVDLVKLIAAHCAPMVGLLSGDILAIIHQHIGRHLGVEPLDVKGCEC